MIYRKNLYSWEQALRILAGLAIVVGAVWYWPGALYGTLIVTAGIMSAMTGVFGFCPACAMVGRRPIGQPPQQDR